MKPILVVSLRRLLRAALPYSSLFATAGLAPLRAQDLLPLDGRWQIARETDRTGERVYDREIEVPSTFETVLGTDFDGIAWYRRTIAVPKDVGDAAIYVVFDAVATAAEVYCNGRLVGEHLGGWTPFWCDLSAALRGAGEDVLEVRVDERVGHNTQGFLPIVAPHFGGIWQSVRLLAVRNAAFAPHRLEVFGRLEADGSGTAYCRAEVLRRSADEALQVRCEVLDGARVIARATAAVDADGSVRSSFPVPGVRPWSPTSPACYATRWTLLRGDVAIDVQTSRTAFRRLEARGSQLLWNGAPLSVRGILHWGLSPPELAPSLDEAKWRRQLEDFRSLGFNTLKCCLFVPPPIVRSLCDEIGLLCWQEYPTWHPKIDAAHREELLREYAEFHWLDGGHASVAFRSITCETGHDADLEVVRALYEKCHADVRDTLVVDDSSWIGWQRIADFWDEHPYGNPRWFERRLVDFEQHQQKAGRKPLLLGECMAADTWVDLEAFDRRGGDPPWWRPDCLVAQRDFESWIVREFGSDCLASFAPTALDFAARLRRAEIECLRANLGDAGYVVSVARDFGKARMGLYDDFDRLKWTAADWQWHRERMLALPTSVRAYVVKEPGQSLLAVPCGFPPGAPRTVPTTSLRPVGRPTRQAVRAEFGGALAEWEVWTLPPFDDTRSRDVEITDHLTRSRIEAIERGARVLLRCSGARGSVAAEPLWYLRGAPFAPAHPVHELLPVEMLIDLAAFDLDGDRLVPLGPWRDQVDPVLAFWETHDLAEVRAHAFAFDTRIGEGRLVVSAFDRDTDAGRYVENALVEHLRSGPPSMRALRAETIAALKQRAEERTLPLPEFRFRTDPDDLGTTERWFAPETSTDGEPWRDLRAGSHWENQSEDLRPYTGIAWYRIDLDLPPDWPTTGTRLLLEGVDDSATVYLDGREIARLGDAAKGITVWLEPQTVELGTGFGPGHHVLALRVVDHAGAGGLWRPVQLTTGPTGQLRHLLR